MFTIEDKNYWTVFHALVHFPEVQEQELGGINAAIEETKAEFLLDGLKESKAFYEKRIAELKDILLEKYQWHNGCFLSSVPLGVMLDSIGCKKVN